MVALLAVSLECTGACAVTGSDSHQAAAAESVVQNGLLSQDFRRVCPSLTTDDQPQYF